MTTIRELEGLVKRINYVTGNPATSYTRTADGSFAANVGNYHLSGAYGGYALYQMAEGGGVHDIFGGHYSKGELYSKMSAFLLGLKVRGER